MGRNVRRVPLDFDHPLNEVWPGFLSPYDFPPCKDCDYDAPPTIMDRLFPTPRHGSGYTPEAYAIAQTFYPHMIGGPMADRLAWCDKLGQAEVDNLIEEGRLRVWRGEWVKEPRTAAEVNADQRRGGLGGHDAINRGILVRFRCERLGILLHCPTCDGNGDIATTEERDAAENWEGTGPPEGDGWQLWETVSEGSPISPVCESAEALAAWLADPNRQKSRPDDEAPRDWMPYDAALKFVNAGWAPSFMATPETGVVSGAEFIGWHGGSES